MAQQGITRYPTAAFTANISNLFPGGRTISVSHVAYGSTRVMATSAHVKKKKNVAGGGSQAAALGLHKKRTCFPQLSARICRSFRQRLLRTGGNISGLNIQFG